MGSTRNDVNAFLEGEPGTYVFVVPSEFRFSKGMPAARLTIEVSHKKLRRGHEPIARLVNSELDELKPSEAYVKVKLLRRGASHVPEGFELSLDAGALYRLLRRICDSSIKRRKEERRWARNARKVK